MKMRDLIDLVEGTDTPLPTIDIVAAGRTMRLINIDGVRAGSFQYGSRDVMVGAGVWRKQASWTASFKFDGSTLSVGATDGIKQMKPKVEAAIRRHLAAKTSSPA